MRMEAGRLFWFGICLVMAATAIVGGWLLVWGNNDPPAPWGMALAVTEIVFLWTAAGILTPSTCREAGYPIFD